jgi:hypothetical protein
MRVAEKFAFLKSAWWAACLILPPWACANAAGTAQHLEAARAELARRSDADSLAAAGLLAAQRPDGLSLVSRAADAAPERTDIVWLQIMLCQQVESCHSEPLERRLGELDPRNGAGWLATLMRAGAAKDDASINEALDGLARSERVDIYYTTLVARLSEAVYGSGQMPVEEAVVEVIGVLAAQAIPAYQLTSRSCRGEALGTAAAVARCRAIASSLEGGDTYITEMIGVAIAKRVWPQDSREWKAADDARRRYDYRAKVSLNLESPKAMKRYVALCGENRREQDVFRQQIIDAGKDPHPPGSP